MIIRVDYGEGVICLPERIKGQLGGLNLCELRVLITLLSPDRAGREVDIGGTADELCTGSESVESAINRLCSLGIISTDGAPKVSVREERASTGKRVITVTSTDSPHYTGEEIEKLFAAEPALGDYIGECQRILGRMFTPTEINKLLALREYYGLDPDYVMLVCHYCKGRSKGTVPYVEKTAKSLADDGITALDALEERLRYMKRYDSTEALVRRLCGMKGRSLTSKEKRFIDRWTELEMPDEVVELAYEVTISNTGAPSLPYMNKVLLNWNEAGYKTGPDVLAGVEAYRKKKESEPASKGTFDTDEFFEAALKRALDGRGKPNGQK